MPPEAASTPSSCLRLPVEKKAGLYHIILALRLPLRHMDAECVTMTEVGETESSLSSDPFPSSDSPLTGLPVEVHEHIIDHLWDDRSALATCSLSCSAWLPSVRHHVFHAIILSAGVDYTRFERLLLSSPGIAPYVHDLTFKDLVMLAPEVSFDPFRILSVLRNVVHLAIYTWVATLIADNTRQRLEDYFPMLRTVSLYICSIYAKDISRLLCACPHLSSVDLEQVGLPVDPQFPRGGLTSMPLQLHPSVATAVSSGRLQLHSLSISVTPLTACLVDWFLSGPFDLHLRNLHLDISIGLAHELHLMRTLFTMTGSTLERLSLASAGRDTAQFAQYFTLTHSINLTTLHLTMLLPKIIQDWEDSSNLIPQYGWVAACLSEITPAHHRIRVIHFHFAAADVFQELGMLPWDQLDVELARLVQGIPQLQVIFTLSYMQTLVLPVEVTNSLRRASIYGHNLPDISAEIAQWEARAYEWICSRVRRSREQDASRVKVVLAANASARQGNPLSTFFGQ